MAWRERERWRREGGVAGRERSGMQRVAWRGWHDEERERVAVDGGVARTGRGDGEREG